MTTSKTREIIDRIFKEPGVKYELTEFEALGKPIHEILDIYDKTVETGREAGKIKFFLKSQAGQLQVEMHQRGSSGQIELYPFDIRKFLVWVAPESLQKEVRKLYDQATESERRSKTLLAQAKLRVEQLIEQAVERSGEKP